MSVGSDSTTSEASIEVKENLSRKRKHDAAGKDPPAKPTSARKRRARVEDDSFDLVAGINLEFSNMDSQLLADYVAKRTRDFERDLSLVELEDKYIPVTSVQDTSSWEGTRLLENLPSFLQAFSTEPEKLGSSSKRNGAPHTIVVAAAGLRAADITRVLRAFQTQDAKVAKLFAKHIKLKDAISFLKGTRVGMAVGTPARLRELVDNGALQLDDLERIVIDASHIDQKKRGVLEIRETQIPLVNWLTQDLKAKLTTSQGAAKLLFY